MIFNTFTRYKETPKKPDNVPIWNGVARSFEDIHPEAALNRPHGSDAASFYMLDEHLRAAYALIAQLHARMMVLEAILGMQEKSKCNAEVS